MMRRIPKGKVVGTLVILGLGGGLLLAGREVVVAPAQAAPGAQICLEAESGKITPVIELFKHQDCSGGAAIEVPEGQNPKVQEGEAPPKLSGESVIPFKVAQEGTYILWARCWWMDGCGNSFEVSVDGLRRSTLSSGNYKRWHWVRGPRITLTPGTHVLRIHNTEDGARMDQVFLTSDPSRVPVGRERVTPAAFVK